MYSIILTREANTIDFKRNVSIFLEGFDFPYTALNTMPDYTGFILQTQLDNKQFWEIERFLRKTAYNSCIYFQKGIPDESVLAQPRTFEFEDYDDTSISGPGMEMDIDHLINTVTDLIKTNIANPVTRKQAVFAVADLWITKIRGWVEITKK